MMRLSVFLIFALVVVNSFATSAQAQIFASSGKKIDRYFGDNLHKYITGLSASQLMDCEAEGRLAVEYSVSEGEGGTDVALLNTLNSAWTKALEAELAISGVTRGEALLSAPLALAVEGKSLDDVLADREALQLLVDTSGLCKPVLDRATDSILDFMRNRDNADEVFAPPADNPYETELGNESLTGLFKSVVEWPVADARVTAQRCYMLSILPNQYVNGEPMLSTSMRLGYSDFMSLEDDALKMNKYFGEILKPMPDNPNSNWPAISEPRNELGALIRGGTQAQLDMFLDAAKTNMPKCLAMISGASQ